MKACGVIVEYNPFHEGHSYHLKKAKEEAKANCLIAVMSGNFLQRGEPAIIDKYHRTKAALHAGVDLVIELPFAFAVQSSELFAKGALLSLAQLHVPTICFGSESGLIDDFIRAAHLLHKHRDQFDITVRSFLKKGLSYPEANQYAYEGIGLSTINMMQPNNILGLSYVRTIIEHKLQIIPYTIKRIDSDFHDQRIIKKIASATSIRKELFENGLSELVKKTMPYETVDLLKKYKTKAQNWHNWEQYFQLLIYRIMTMSKKELRSIHGMDEGLENRLEKTALQATNLYKWLATIKTRRYTQTRLQRLFVHLLMNSTKQEITKITSGSHVPYIRLLGMSKIGQAYLASIRKNIDVPIYTNLNRANRSILSFDERAMNIYYSILPPAIRHALRQQEFQLPIRL